MDEQYASPALAAVHETAPSTVAVEPLMAIRGARSS